MRSGCRCQNAGVCGCCRRSGFRFRIYGEQHNDRLCAIAEDTCYYSSPAIRQGRFEFSHNLLMPVVFLSSGYLYDGCSFLPSFPSVNNLARPHSGGWRTLEAVAYYRQNLQIGRRETSGSRALSGGLSDSLRMGTASKWCPPAMAKWRLLPLV